jgi:hypothetical protein
MFFVIILKNIGFLKKGKLLIPFSDADIAKSNVM